MVVLLPRGLQGIALGTVGWYFPGLYFAFHCHELCATAPGVRWKAGGGSMYVAWEVIHIAEMPIRFVHRS